MMPVAMISPNRLIMLTVCPVTPRMIRAPANAVGMPTATHSESRTSRNRLRAIKTRTIPISPLPTSMLIRPSTSREASAQTLRLIPSGSSGCCPRTYSRTLAAMVEVSCRGVL